MATKETTQKAPAPVKVWVRAVYGDMLNLYTNVWLTKDPKKVEVDPYIQAQLDAVKLEIVADV